MPERVTRSAAETEVVGEELAATLSPGDLILLRGELGSGKTTFVRGLARGLGSSAQVQSPTFQLVRVYPGRVQLGHVDLYRLEAGSGIDELGLEDLLAGGVVAVEWGERLRPRPPGAIDVGFRALSPEERVISLP